MTDRPIVRQLSSRALPFACLSTAALLALAAGCSATQESTATAQPSAQPAAEPTPPAASISQTPSPRTYQPTGTLLDALQPKEATGVDRFLQQFPEADGRGITIAIFDTGVDPGAPGMQVTTTGEPKVVDVIDASGSGDVDTSTVRILSDEGTIEGLAGTTLTPNTQWANPTGEFRVGLKPSSELFPAGLVSRVMADRDEPFTEAHNALVAQAKRDLIAFDDEHPKPTADQLEARGELEKRIELLGSLRDSDTDPGPLYDCIVWHDGEHWRAAVDTDTDGDFADEQALTNFRTERQFATFGDKDLLNFALNIYNDGDVLSIVTDAGSHGTHVAGITAAHFPDQPELNGMAPGAQIVSVKIGDTRLGSSSVNTGLIRGLIAVVEHDVDMINMSYGGPAAFPDTRYRIDQIATDIVDNHNVVFVASAGNAGPALSTVGGPGGTTTAIIGVGASITPEMMEAQYAVREGWGELQYPWSSRGPTLDGDMGVDITAPGGAISPVPNWTLQKNQLSNGTSMSSPSACGAIALALSKLKQEGQTWHPASIKRAIKATALTMPGQSPWAQGAGMLQIDAAYEYLANYVDDETRDMRFHARGPGSTRGLYLREPNETDEPTEFSLSLSPAWPEDIDNRRRVDFEARLNLEATEPWIEVARFHNIAASGRSTTVRVDPTGLEHGAHFAEILATDQDHPERGPMFRFPVTVIKGMQLTAEDDYTFTDTITTTSGDLSKYFFHAPVGATWIDVIARRLDSDTSRTLILHMTQLADDEAYVHTNSRSWISFDDDDVETRSMAIRGGGTVELAVAQNWSSLGQGEFEIEVRFRGLTPEPSQVMIHGAAPVTPLDIRSPLREANVSPSGSLTGLTRSTRPTDWDITPLDPQRDMLPEGRQIYQLILTYDLAMPADGSVTIDPAINSAAHAWDEYESFLWHVTNGDGEQLANSAGEDETIELDEGEYTLTLHIRHEDPSSLDALTDLSVMLTHGLKSPVGLSFAGTPDAALAGRGGFRSRELDAGGTARAYIATPTKLPDFAEPGDVLVGSFTLGARTDLGGATTKPGGWPVAMAVAPEPNEKPEIEPAPEPDESNNDEASDEADEDTDLAQDLADEPADEEDTSEVPTRLDELHEDMLALKIAALDDLMGDDDADLFDRLTDEIRSEIEESDAESLQLALAEMRRAAQEPKDQSPEDAESFEPTLSAGLAAAQDVIERIDTDALAAYRGVNRDEDSDDFDEELDEAMAAQTDALLAAHDQIIALRTKALENRDEGTDADGMIEALEDAIAEHRRWEDPEAETLGNAELAIAQARGRYATALAMIDAKLEDEPSAELREQRAELLDSLGWGIWADRARARAMLASPAFERLF